MNDRDDDKLIAAARKLATEVTPQRDLWPGIEDAIKQPKRSRWAPMLAQAAAVVLLVGASSFVTYIVVREQPTVIQNGTPFLNTETVAFAGRNSLGPAYKQARGDVVTSLDEKLKSLSPEARADVERNLAVIRQAIVDINEALNEEPDNKLLRELLADAYRDELVIMQRVDNLTRRVMARQDI